MAREAVEFISGADDVDPAIQRRRKQLTLRERGIGAFGGVHYGLSAFGYPLGAITGVGQGGAPPATDALGEQFGGDAGMGGDSGGDAGSGGTA